MKISVGARKVTSGKSERSFDMNMAINKSFVCYPGYSLRKKDFSFLE
jgi:hypothetical protein